MSNGSRSHHDNELMREDQRAPRRSIVTSIFDLFYPLIVAIIMVKIAQYLGYIQPNQIGPWL